ncbi:MAG: hypothetical protein PQJ59_16750 [Spirochaetales bacterium]|nr:hypothetical protein [Spirochaetales bacterium]
MDDYIGFEGLGNDIEFCQIDESDKAYKVQIVGEEIELWLPKSVFDDSGCLTEAGCEIFYINYAEAIGE